MSCAYVHECATSVSLNSHKPQESFDQVHMRRYIKYNLNFYFHISYQKQYFGEKMTIQLLKEIIE